MSQPSAGGPATDAKARRGRLLRLVLWSFLFWTALGVFFAAQLYFAGLSWGTALEWSLPRWYTWGLLTPAVFRLDRQLVGTWPLIARVALHVPLGLAWTSVAILMRLVARPFRGAPFPTDVSAFFIERFSADLSIYAVIACVSLVRAYTTHMRDRELEARDLAINLERQLSEARLHSLRAQLQPHFLFNALNTISSFTESDPRLARRLMERLGDLLRASLAHTAQPLITLGDELTFLDDYLAIESARFEDRIAVSVRADDHLTGVRVPSFLLQPLVENAIRHGVAPRLSGGRIDVTVRHDGADMELRVCDDGLGLPTDWDLEHHPGVGLRNLRSRLEQIYGRGDLLQIGRGAAGGVDVRVRLPMPNVVPQPR